MTSILGRTLSISVDGRGDLYELRDVDRALISESGLTLFPLSEDDITLLLEDSIPPLKPILRVSSGFVGAI